MARDEGCCETSPLHSSVVLAVELMVQLLPFPLVQTLEKLAESIDVVLRSWATLTVLH